MSRYGKAPNIKAQYQTKIHRRKGKLSVPFHMTILKDIKENLIREYETWETEFPLKEQEITEQFEKEFKCLKLLKKEQNPSKLGQKNIKKNRKIWKIQLKLIFKHKFKNSKYNSNTLNLPIFTKNVLKMIVYIMNTMMV